MIGTKAWLRCFSFCLAGQLMIAAPLCCLATSNTSDLSYADLVKLGECEKVLYGTTHKNLPSGKRIEALEVELFGEKHPGSYQNRVNAIAVTLGSDKANLLLPPLAAALDRGASAPALAATSTIESDMPPLPATASDRAKGVLRQAIQDYSNGRMPEAEAAFEQVLLLDKNNPDAYFNLGAIAESRGDLKTALKDYKAALKLNPHDTELQNAVASTENKLVNQKTIQPNNAPSWNELKGQINEASTAYRNGNYDSAIQTLQGVIRYAPNEADVYYALAQCYKSKQQFMEARSCLSRALALQPNNQLYKEAFVDLDRRIASGGENNAGNPPYDTIASTNNSAPAGQLTPFTGIDSNPQQRAGYGYYGYASRGYGYGPGGYFTTNRLERAAIGSLSGAAIGALFGGGYRGRGAFAGAAIGGLFGLLTGH